MSDDQDRERRPRRETPPRRRPACDDSADEREADPPDGSNGSAGPGEPDEAADRDETAEPDEPEPDEVDDETGDDAEGPAKPRSTRRSGRNGDGGGRGKGTTADRRRRGGLTPAAAARRAAEQIVALTGRELETVVSIERDREQGGWQIGVEVVETRRIPDSADILALFAVRVDENGELDGFHRAGRYSRGRLHEGGR